MIVIPETRKIYASLQKQLYYLIPEKWDKICLYASVMEQIMSLETGELFFYYLPKGILKKNWLNVYEIPAEFNLNEEEYIKLVEKLYNTIKELREVYKKQGVRIWSNVTIRMEGIKFEIEFDYENLTYSPYSNIERHIIWKYKNLDLPLESFTRKERKLILKYLNEYVEDENQKEIYTESIYKRPIKNVIDYNKERNPVDIYIQESEKQRLEEEKKQKIEEQRYTYIRKEKKSSKKISVKEQKNKKSNDLEQNEAQKNIVKSQILNHM